MTNIFNQLTNISTIIPQGWQCPVCKKVNAPHKDSCDCHTLTTTPIVYPPYITYPSYPDPFQPYVTYVYSDSSTPKYHTINEVLK
jgi:hypothetical protein